MKIKVTFHIENENMSDEEYYDQEDRFSIIDEYDLYDILTYGRFSKQVNLSEGDSVVISNIQTIN